MTQQVEAVYEHGVLRPLEPLTLAESQRVKLTISTPDAGRYPPDMEFLEWAMPRIPSLEEVQDILSKIPESLADDFAAEREE